MLDDKGIKDCWKEYMEKLMNEENQLRLRRDQQIVSGWTK